MTDRDTFTVLLAADRRAERALSLRVGLLLAAVVALGGWLLWRLV